MTTPEIKYCECGCGEQVKNRFVNAGHATRGKHRTPPKPCKCGCEKMTNWNKDYAHGHNGLKFPWKPKTSPQLCECGCGQMTKIGRKFVNGHNGIGENNGMCKKRKHPEVILNHHLCKCGCGKLIASNNEFISGHNRKGGTCTKEHKERIGIGNQGKVRSGEVKKRWSETKKRLWRDQEYSSMMMRALAVRPNKPENFLLNLLEEMFPGEWRYTGDFSFMINGKNPDFTNINGQKKLIELFGDYYHRGQEPQDRINVFKAFGWDTLVIWEHELKNFKGLIGKLQNFNQGIEL